MQEENVADRKTRKAVATAKITLNTGEPVKRVRVEKGSIVIELEVAMRLHEPDKPREEVKKVAELAASNLLGSLVVGVEVDELTVYDEAGNIVEEGA